MKAYVSCLLVWCADSERGEMSAWGEQLFPRPKRADHLVRLIILVRACELRSIFSTCSSPDTGRRKLNCLITCITLVDNVQQEKVQNTPTTVAKRDVNVPRIVLLYTSTNALYSPKKGTPRTFPSVSSVVYIHTGSGVGSTGSGVGVT